jgi:hypothetical protein
MREFEKSAIDRYAIESDLTIIKQNPPILSVAVVMTHTTLLMLIYRDHEVMGNEVG